MASVTKTEVAAVDWDAVGEEATGHLQALLRIDTTNPPGNETAAAEYIAEAVRAEGIEAEIVEAAPGRGTVVARLRAEQPAARPLLLMGHTDVVSVERGKWTRDPFGGEVVDGYVWGRGALDMKGQVAAELTALLSLKRRGVPLDRDVILAAFADEEAGGELGAAWIWEHRRDLIDAEYAINEGGGRAATVGGRRVYLCQVGEKGVARLRITATGEPGHASTPIAGTAMAKLGRTLVRLDAWRSPVRLTAAVRQMLEAMAGALDGAEGDPLRGFLAAPRAEAVDGLPLDETTLRTLRATVRDTAVPTVVHGGHRINVIPSEVVLEVDGRILPGTEPEEWRERIEGVVGEEVAVELLSREEGIEAEPASPLFDAIAATIGELDPGATVAPYLCAGGTDARHLPGVKVYGFFPIPPSARSAVYAPLVHGHDERIAVDDLGFASRFLVELVDRFCGAAA